ncbi:uncharacterized protein Tco025E_00162 [Trypanosoma conorhini]|uniref:RPGR-interacting protein 1 first C2 domain-containing protein n=1 Tax=Trypanosoma conorhini TaxID=83891 RepID=A0A422QC92_9TRYP|nr:uncharacterized protein Tco025E_00162 [Trypanosoma conorhini]RNF27601.1 hypothetical protein Tco025E_00162 [Trypanosoma conorhini]
MAQRAASRRTTEDWQDAFYGLEERHRQLQRRFNEQEQELKLLKVSQRRDAAAPAFARGGTPRTTPLASGRASHVRAAPSASVRAKQRASLAGTEGGGDGGLARGAAHDGPPERNVGLLAVPAAARRADAGAAAAELTSAWSAAPPPDPSMVWGMENSIQNYVTANALYHANEELRQRLDDAVGFVKTLQHELASSRSLAKTTQQRLEEATQQMHQLVRERDLAGQKLSVSQQAVVELERSLKNHATEEERIRFSLESQITELRSRLVVGADSNELLTRDVRTLLTEVKEKASEAQSLRSKLTLAEAALSSQKQNNENLLVELRSLNTQLINERKRLLSMTREAQLASLRAEDAKDVEARLAEAVESRGALEREHVRLMESLVDVTESALRQAREEVRQDIADWRASAAHWEEVSQLLYKDIAQRTQAHLQCREECEEAKRDRDDASMALREAWEELKLCRAKLDIVWPTHRDDTRDLTPAEMLSTFGNYRAVFRQRRDTTTRRGGAAATPETNDGDEGAITVELCEAPVEEQLRELHEANGALLAELEQLRITNELQAERLRKMETRVRQEREEVQVSAEALGQREEATQRFLQTQLDHVAFLEAQVRSLRGFDVAPNISLRELSPGETVFELFLGQLLSTETPAGVGLRDTFPPVFCSVDFLLHETITTPIVTGLNGFLDTTIAFCVAMDALLQCYLQSRELLVQLHRVRPQDEINEIASTQSDKCDALFAERLYATLAEGSVSLWPLVSDEKCRDARRPTLRGHIPLRTPDGHHIASVEFTVTVRTPFSDAFRALAAEASKGRHLQHPQPPSAAATPAETNTSRGEGRMQLVPTRPHTETFGSVSTTSSSSTSLLESRSHDRTVGFTLVPRAAAMASVSSSSASPTPIRSLLVDVCRLHLPPSLAPVPRLSCYYALTPLGRDVYLPAPPTPRYECEYLQDGGSHGTRFPIASVGELLAVTREPFMLFFFDESSPAVRSSERRGDGPYWAMAMAEWRLALERPEEYVSLELPLMDQKGCPVQGAFVQVRLLATSNAQDAETGLAAALERARAATASLREQPQQYRHPSAVATVLREARDSTSRSSAAATAAAAAAAVSGNAAPQNTPGGRRTYDDALDSVDLEMIRRQLDG